MLKKKKSAGVIWRGKEAISKRKDYFGARTFFSGEKGKARVLSSKLPLSPGRWDR